MARILFPLLLLIPLPGQAGLDKVIQDIPGRLEMEIAVPAAAFRMECSQTGCKVVCEGCQIDTRPGAPDLPVYRFNVLSGSAPPQVSIQILETEIRTVAQDLSPVPFPLSPTRMDYRADPRLFGLAADPVAEISDLRYLRGTPLRLVTVPMALWSQGGKTLTLIRRMRVELTFPGLRTSPAANRLQGPFLDGVKNPLGGAYLYATQRPRVARKSGAAPAVLGSRFLKIRVGDRRLDNLDEDRMYALAFSEVSQAMGGLVGVDINDLALYAGPRDSLTRSLDSTFSSGTLREIPMEVLDKNASLDFDEGDTLRFFGHGTSLWKRIPEAEGTVRYEFAYDPYSYDNFYYLDFSKRGGGPAPRLTAGKPMAAAASVQSSSYAYVRAEKDLETASMDLSPAKDLETGFDWHWHWRQPCNASGCNTLTSANLFSVETDTLENLRQNPGDSLFVGFFEYGDAQPDHFTAFLGGRGTGLDAFAALGSRGAYYVHEGSWAGAPAFKIDSLQWNSGDYRFEGYTVCYPSNHVFSGQPLWIFPAVFGARVSYRVAGGAGLNGLRVEDGVATRLFKLDGEGVFTDSLDAASDARYLVYRDALPMGAAKLSLEIPPVAKTALANLVTGDGENPEYLIITPKVLLEQALALRDFRNETDGQGKSKRALPVKTSVVLVEDIYRQFSSGRMSPVAIRDFLRWAYNKWGGNNPGSNPLNYVLLFGDGHYDYRSIKTSLRENSPPNLIPPWEHLPEDKGIDETASDDFFVWLDAGEHVIGRAVMDLAIGRLPVQTSAQALDVIRKIKDNEDPAKAGEWRSRVILAADDAWQLEKLDGIPDGHTTDTEKLGKAIVDNWPGLILEKVYLLDYPMNSAYHKPEAAQDLLTLINRGAAVLNYVGHGSESQWADEILLQSSDAVSRVRNQGKVAMINAFSCTVGRFESLAREGMSEQFVRQRDGGAIAAISATRESYAGPNVALAEEFYRRAFPSDGSHNPVPVGDALREAKGHSTTTDSYNDMKYVLLGEPVLLLRKPKLGLSFTHVLDTIRALDCDTIKGSIIGGSGRGFVNIRILAGSSRKVYELPVGMITQYAEKRGNILFEQTVPYENFAFAAYFFIPKQIPFGDTNAQVLAYAWDSRQEAEGSLARRDLAISGVSKSCASESDGKGPLISITGCEGKETGGLDFPDRVRLSLPYCLQIKVEDPLGVLSAAGPNEGTTLEIPGVMDPFHPQPGTDELKRKTYQLVLNKRDMRPGSHVLKVSAQDVYGNSSQRQLRLDLTQDSSLNTITAYNAPNPLKRDSTTFHFSTVLPADETDLVLAGRPDRVAFEIRIFNQSGQLVRMFREAKSGMTTWNGRDEWGNRLANGVYFYKVTARQNLVDPGPVSYRTLSSKRNILVISR